MADTLRCREAFSFDRDGVTVVVNPGALRPSGHPDVKGREGLFEPVEEAATRQASRPTLQAERATAAPGERRTVTHPEKTRK